MFGLLLIILLLILIDLLFLYLCSFLFLLGCNINFLLLRAHHKRNLTLIFTNFYQLMNEIYNNNSLAHLIIIHIQLIIIYYFVMGKLLFPSRPKPSNNSQQTKKPFDKQKAKQKKMFFDTIKDMRQMVQKHYGTYNKDTLGMQKTNTKVPYTHLMGRRKKIVERYSAQKARARQEGIQYDSSLQLLNSNIVEKSKMQKDQFARNKYKFQGQRLNDGRLGRQSDGMLTLSKRDLMRINGKQFDPKKRNQPKQEKQFKHKRVKKFKKGKKGGRKH